MYGGVQKMMKILSLYLHGELRKPTKNIALYLQGGLRNYMETFASFWAWWTTKTHENYCSCFCVVACEIT
jgi:hypothetical protein